MSEAPKESPARKVERVLRDRRIALGRERFAERGLPDQLVVREVVFRADFESAGSDIENYHYESESLVAVDPVGPIRLVFWVSGRVEPSCLTRQFDAEIERAQAVLPGVLRTIEPDLIDLARSYDFHIEFESELQFPRFWNSFAPSVLCLGMRNGYRLVFDNTTSNFHGLDICLDFDDQGRASVAFDS